MISLIIATSVVNTSAIEISMYAYVIPTILWFVVVSRDTQHTGITVTNALKKLKNIIKIVFRNVLLKYNVYVTFLWYKF